MEFPHRGQMAMPREEDGRVEGRDSAEGGIAVGGWGRRWRGGRRLSWHPTAFPVSRLPHDGLVASAMPPSGTSPNEIQDEVTLNDRKWPAGWSHPPSPHPSLIKQTSGQFACLLQHSPCKLLPNSPSGMTTH